jgi:integrase
MAKLWAKSIGERGNRVRLYEARPGGNLMRSLFVNGKEDRRSLGHSDREQAIRDAYLLIGGRPAGLAAAKSSPFLSLTRLQARYLSSPQHAAKKPRTQREDAGKLARVIGFLGTERDVDSLSESDVYRYAQKRRNGGVRDGTIGADLLALVNALNWATRERDNCGQRLLSESPLRGIVLPKEKNVRRPVVTDAEFRSLLGVAGQISPLLALALIVAESTGRRLSAWRQLQWADVDLAAGAIRWRAETDKKGYEQTVPIAPALHRALTDANNSRWPNRVWVFPSPCDPGRPCSRDRFDRWLRRAYAMAKVTKRPGGLWHAFRRKWATERKGLPLADVAAAGGWRDTQTLLRSYQLPDEATIRNVVLNPTFRLVSA